MEHLLRWVFLSTSPGCASLGMLAVLSDTAIVLTRVRGSVDTTWPGGLWASGCSPAPVVHPPSTGQLLQDQLIRRT